MKNLPRQGEFPNEEQIHSELLFISIFLRKEKRDRWKDFLPSPKNRIKVVQTLDHFRDLDERYLSEIPKEEQTPERLYRRLRDLGAPEQCHLISSARELDGKTLPLIEALQRIAEAGCGTMMICVPDRLGYFHDEDERHQWILEKGR